MRSRSKIFRVLLMLLCFVLCFVFGMMGVKFLFARSVSITAPRPRQNGKEKLRPSATNLPESLSLNSALAKSGPPKDRLWHEIKNDDLSGNKTRSALDPEFYRALRLDETAQRELLRRAPMEFSKAARQTQVVMTLPMPDGTFARFRVEESPVLAPRLAAFFPAIRTYRGQGLDDSTATTRFASTPAGFHAIVLSTQGTVIVEPAVQGRSGEYVSYNQRDAPKDGVAFSCLVSEAGQSLA